MKIKKVKPKWKCLYKGNRKVNWNLNSKKLIINGNSNKSDSNKFWTGI